MRFARGSLGTLLALAFGLAASVVLNRMLGAEGRGAYALAVKTAGLVVAWAQWGAPEVMLNAFTERRAPQGTILGTALAVVVLSSLVFGLAFAGCYPLLAGGALRGVTPGMFGAAVGSSLFAVAFMVQRRVVQLRGELVVYNLLDVAKSAVFLVLVVVCLSLWADEREGAVVAFLGAEVLLAGLGAAYLRWRVERDWRVDRGLAAEFMRSGFVVQLGIVGMFLAGQLGPYIVNLFGSLEEVGYYATALGLATYVTFVSVSVRTVLQARMPSLTGGSIALAELTVAVARNGLIWLVGAALGLALLGRPVIVLLYGREFEAAYEPMLLLLPGMVFWGLQQIVASYFTALRMYRLPTFGAWVVAVVGLGLQVAATPLLGVQGAAAALSAGYAAAFLFYLVVFCRHAGYSVVAFVPTLDDARYYLQLARRLAARGGSLAPSP